MRLGSEGLDGIESWAYPAIAEGYCWDGPDVRILVGWCACMMWLEKVSTQK